MISTNIYTSEKTLPYVYRLDNPITGEFYIGYRRANTLPSHLDIPTYKTSAPKITNTFEIFEWKILAEFYDGDDAYDHEQLIIYKNWDNPLLLNESCYYGKERFRNISPPSDETRAKMSSAKKGKKQSPEHIAKRSATRIGKKQSAECVAKRVAANKGYAHSEESKAKISDAHRGKKRLPFSEEHKSNISASAKGKTKSAEHIAKIAAAKTGKPCSNETKAKISTTATGKKRGPRPPETIAKIVAAKKEARLIRLLQDTIPLETI